MKKSILLSIALMLVASACAFAQDIIGTWQSKHSEDDMSGTETLAVAKDGNFNVVLEVTLNLKDNVDKFTFNMSFGGTWTLANDVFTETVDSKSFKTEVSEYPDGMPKGLLNMMKNMMVSEMKKEVKKPVNNTIVKCTEDTLVLKDKKGEVETYTKVK